MKISTIMPTRNRPENLTRIFQSALDTVTRKDLYEFSLRLDDDDVLSLPVIKEFQEKGLQIRYVFGGREYCHGKYWNDAWKNATGEIFQMSGDDFIYRTVGWDEEIRKEFLKYDDRILFVYGDDMIQHGGLGTHAFIHKNWTDAVGYFVQERTIVFYHDTWNDVLANKVGRRVYREDLIFEHMHPICGKSEVDSVMNDMCNKSVNIDDKIWAMSWPEMVFDAKKIVTKMTDLSTVNIDWPYIEGENTITRAGGKAVLGSNAYIAFSILVPTMPERKNVFSRLMNVLAPQLTDEVEILFLNDEPGKPKKTTGEKRNELLKMARGEWVAFVDDDDLVNENYIALILHALKSTNCDVIGIHLLMTFNEDPETECRTYHSLRYDKWYDEPDPDRPGKRRYFRNPNHLNPVRRELAINAGFPDKSHGEDHEYSKALLPHLKTETYIHIPLYYYLARA